MISASNQSFRDTAILFTLLEEQLEYFMTNDKIFMQKNLSLVVLAAMLHTNVNYLSQVINNRLHTNFNDYINSYRVKEACSLLQNTNSPKLTIDHVGDVVGFTSRSTYYSCFKKFVGESPAAYQKNTAQK